VIHQPRGTAVAARQAPQLGLDKDDLPHVPQDNRQEISSPDHRYDFHSTTVTPPFERESHRARRAAARGAAETTLMSYASCALTDDTTIDTKRFSEEGLGVRVGLPVNSGDVSTEGTMNRMIRKLIPKRLARAVNLLSKRRQGALRHSKVDSWRHSPVFSHGCPSATAANPLERYFDAHVQGAGIWKWKHYFDIYRRHLSKFVGRQPHVLEIGVYSGGSLGVWKSYFGEGCSVYGVDIQPACKSYEDESIKVFIGDQADRVFWGRLRKNVAELDVIIDDGGHTPVQQIVTLEETLPYLRPGGVYICEDIHGSSNAFSWYVDGLAANLNADNILGNVANNERRLVSPTTAFQAAVRSVHLYPYAVVIERTDAPVRELVAPKHGTHWQPFLK